MQDLLSFLYFIFYLFIFEMLILQQVLEFEVEESKKQKNFFSPYFMYRIIFFVIYLI